MTQNITPESSSDLILAVAQSPADLSGRAARLAWLEQYMSGLKGRGIDLLVLPELFLTGYNIGDDITAWAEPLDGPSSQGIAALARRHGIAIHYGFAEAADEVVYNAAACVGPDGVCLACHRKLLLPPGFEGDHFAPGTGYTTFDLGGVRVATLICYDAEFPETLRAVATAGAELVVVPTALGAQWGVVADKVIPARAFENGVYVAYANSAGTENGMAFYGGSCIVSPTGQDLARAGSAPETLIAGLSRSAVQAAQTRLPYLADRQRLPRG